MSTPSLHAYELGQPSKCQGGRLATPRSILRNWVWFLDTMLIMHRPTNWKPAFLIFLFLSATEITIRENTRATATCLWKKKEKRPTFSFFARAVQLRGLIFRSKNVKFSGASQKCHFPHFLSKKLDLYMESNFGNISWWVANWAMKLLSMFFLSLQHCLH